MKKCITLSILLLFFMPVSLSAKVVVKMYSTKPSHQFLGVITFKNINNRLQITPKLADLPPGEHGFHLHDQPSCDAQGMAAGGHYDPRHTHKHKGPYSSQGHGGDLPALIVNKNGTTSKKPLFAPHLSEAELSGHAVMIHAGGDNYSDSPKPLGGGGERIACGVI